MRRHANFSAWYSFHPGENGKIFQHSLIDFIHTNAMNLFSKLTNGKKAMKNRYKLFLVFAKNRASPCQLFRVIFVPSGSEREDFSKQTDWFYSYQCNEPILKVDKWGKSYEKSLQAFYSFFEKLSVAMPTFQLDIHSIWLRKGRFFKTDWLILFIPMQWTNFHFDIWW